ncbi:DUF2793 domain-containing protein [Pelagerythrobacter rhizovicinus]|uniref:DUF2793 domain-containing protein n=1 Tax=Pelagerythrobacter rhizovicinus TaxID=2268576 RepID=A0A4Q2KI72_9SPHN|nr:DUF2793 domain-containing protein [Pelagerythrobacter rhizovicinus]RXZ64875.1 DUF2793 domain-containing protein [Pelagerythrobacter rhizovicinus]
MSQPVTFESATPRFDLPHLFPAQSQKEFIVNESHARIDMLLHCAVEGEADDPPAAPAEGEVWIVGPAPTGDWNGRAGQLAGRQAGGWLFSAPRDGLRVFDKAARQVALYDGEWLRAAAPENPTGGSTIDAEARTVIDNLIETLRVAGILPRTE